MVDSASAGITSVVATQCNSQYFTTTGEIYNLPHLRQDCLRHDFENPATQFDSCPSCFCYVCDCQANNCKNWLLHCKASNKGRDARKWKAVRRALRPLKNKTLSSTNELSKSFISEKVRTNVFRFTSLQPRLTLLPESKHLSLLHGICTCPYLCFPIQRLIQDIDRPFILIENQHYQDVLKHLKWVCELYGSKLYVKCKYSKIYVAKKIFRGQYQEPPWRVTSRDYKGLKVGRYQCPYRNCGCWSPVAFSTLQCLYCKGVLHVTDVPYIDGKQEYSGQMSSPEPNMKCSVRYSNQSNYSIDNVIESGESLRNSRRLEGISCCMKCRKYGVETWKQPRRWCQSCRIRKKENISISAEERNIRQVFSQPIVKNYPSHSHYAQEYSAKNHESDLYEVEQHHTTILDETLSVEQRKDINQCTELNIDEHLVAFMHDLSSSTEMDNSLDSATITSPADKTLGSESMYAPWETDKKASQGDLKLLDDDGNCNNSDNDINITEIVENTLDVRADGIGTCKICCFVGCHLKGTWYLNLNEIRSSSRNIVPVYCDAHHYDCCMSRIK